MRRPRAVWVNSGLGVLLFATGTAAYLAIGDPSTATTSTARTGTVTRGSVTATVSGSGNVASAATATLNFGAGGTVTAVYVKAGNTVHKGEAIARISDAAARVALQQARAQLLSAKASYLKASGGQGSLTAAKNQNAIDQATLQVTTTATGLSSARSTLSSHTTAQNKLVAAALAAWKAGTGTQAAYTSAVTTRTSVLAKDTLAVRRAQVQHDAAVNALADAELTASTAASSASADLAGASSAVSQAEQAVSDAQKTLDLTVLRAPITGTVLSVSGYSGQTVSAGSTTLSTGSVSSSTSSSSSSAGGAGGSQSGSTSSSSSSSGFAVIADLNTYAVTANIAEADASSVAVGQPATVTVSATGAQLSGTVTAISLTSTTSNNVVEYPVTVTVKDAKASVKLGATVSFVITTGSASDTLVVPSSAVTTVGTRHTVTVIRNNVPTTVQVEQGLVGDNGIEIRSGLSEGETVQLSSSSSSGSSSGSGSGGGPGGIGGLGGLR